MNEPDDSNKDDIIRAMNAKNRWETNMDRWEKEMDRWELNMKEWLQYKDEKNDED